MSSEAITQNDLTAILNEVLPPQGSVYIVEQGVDNDWHYKKYSDGTFEAWWSKLVNVAVNTASGSLYKSADQTVNLPSFIPTDYTKWAVSGSVNGSEWIAFLTWGSANTPPIIAYNIIKTTSRASANRGVQLMLKGNIEE